MEEPGKEMGKNKAKVEKEKKRSRSEDRHWEAENEDCENWEAGGSNR